MLESAFVVGGLGFKLVRGLELTLWFLPLGFTRL